MSVTQRIAFGAAASWFSRGFTIVVGLVLLPVLFRHLPREELGVWLLLGQSWAVLGILDFGFGATLTRRIALAKGRGGAEPVAGLATETLREIADLVEMGRKVFYVLALAALIVSWGAGFLYLQSLELNGIPLHTAWGAWAILCVSQALGLWAMVWTCLLQGFGYVGWDAILASLVNALTLLIQIAVVLLGAGLVALAVVAAIGALAQRVLILGFARRKRPELFAMRGHWNAAVFRKMLAPSTRAWLTTLGLALVLNTDQLFIVKMEGASQLPAYSAAYLVLLNLNMLSVALASASAVFISHLWQSGDVLEVHRVVIRNLRFGLGLMACGGACILALGPDLFDLWLGPGHFIGYPILIVFFLLLFLEAQCFIISTSSRATEDEAFAPWALGSGFLKLALSFGLGLRYGLLGIALGTLIAQLATNHWFMVWHGLTRLKLGVGTHLMKVILPISSAFAVTYWAVWIPRQMMYAVSPWVVVGVGVSMASLVLIAVVWGLVLDNAERLRVVRSVRLI